MTQKYRYGFRGMSPDYYQQSVVPAPAPAKASRPVYGDIPFFIKSIKRGGMVTVDASVMSALGSVLPSNGVVYPRSFVFWGSSDLWLLSGSHTQGQTLFGTDIPLDTFRVGAPSDISWPSTNVFGTYALQVENRSPARNAPEGRFLARMSCTMEQG